VKPGRDELLRREALSLQEFLADLKEKGTRLNLVILDACRENPFEQVAGRSVGRIRGLAITEPPEGTFIMYSAGAGETALDALNDDDRNPNSVYTRHLLPLLKTPSLTLTDVAEQLRVSVRQIAATVQHRQTPAYYNQVLGRVCLAGGDCGPRGAPASVQSAEVERTWDRVKDTTSIPALDAFRQQYGKSNLVYDRLAEGRIEELKKLAMVAPPQVKPEPPPKVVVPAVAMSPDPALTPGRVFRDCPIVCPEMVVVPAGEFMMGSPVSEAGRATNEGPQRKVTIVRPFAVGKVEVTFSEWDACVADGGCTHRPSDQGWGRGRRPVINVSWQDAKEYVGWLSRKTAETYRLLSEAEWEYAARAGTTTRFAFGDTINKSQAQYSEGSWGSAGKTVEVGSFTANTFKLHDMHGNVSEWVEDNWHPNLQGAPTDGSVWLGGDVVLRAVRGGDWVNKAAVLRSAYRHASRLHDRYSGVGFRVARTP
jgi:formylglycine-generating enzyme required for sulfatase activity